MTTQKETDKKVNTRYRSTPERADSGKKERRRGRQWAAKERNAAKTTA
jgi:hypothetical protein